VQAWSVHGPACDRDAAHLYSALCVFARLAADPEIAGAVVIRRADAVRLARFDREGVR
jgi:hypothetical protein